jgi:small GTP-binding protein
LKIAQSDITFKICIFGAGGVGKTTLARRYLTGLYDLSTKITMGAEIHVKYVEVLQYKVVLQIWDFGGEEQFRFLLPTYARGAFGGIFMYDISRIATTINLEEWLDNFKEGLLEGEEDVPILLVGGKLDLEENRTVTDEDALKLKGKYGFFDLIECSSKTGENVEEIFESIVRAILKHRKFID